jgi:hypothetical protein
VLAETTSIDGVVHTGSLPLGEQYSDEARPFEHAPAADTSIKILATPDET